MTAAVGRRQGKRNLLRYIHTKSYSRISGFRGVKFRENIIRNRIILSLFALTTFSIGLWFVIF
jgi:hypothetical protein